MNGRIQDAITGRFLSADPTIPDPSVAQDFNRYSYVRNNPLTFTDPTGFTETKGTPFDSTLNSFDYNASLSAALGGSITGITLGTGWQRTCVENGADGYSGCGAWHRTGSDNVGSSGDGGSSGGGAGGGGGGPPGGGQLGSTPPQQIPCLTGVSCYVKTWSQGDVPTVTVPAPNSSLQACLKTVHVGASGLGGAVGGFVTGGLAGAAIGGGVGLLAGGAEVALGVYDPGIRGAAVGGAEGALESAVNGEGFASGALQGAVRGGLGETYGVGAAVGTAVAFGEATARGFTSMTPAARGALAVATRGVLAGWGAGIGLITQQATELLGEQACEAAFGGD